VLVLAKLLRCAIGRHRTAVMKTTEPSAQKEQRSIGELS
jgi:hypothetical protein